MIPVRSHAREPGHDQCRSQVDAPGHDSQLLRAEAQEEIAKPRRSQTAAHLREPKAFDTVHIPARPNTSSRALEQSRERDRERAGVTTLETFLSASARVGGFHDAYGPATCNKSQTASMMRIEQSSGCTRLPFPQDSMSLSLPRQSPNPFRIPVPQPW